MANDIQEQVSVIFPKQELSLQHPPPKLWPDSLCFTNYRNRKSIIFYWLSIFIIQYFIQTESHICILEGIQNNEINGFFSTIHLKKQNDTNTFESYLCLSQLNRLSALRVDATLTVDFIAPLINSYSENYFNSSFIITWGFSTHTNISFEKINSYFSFPIFISFIFLELLYRLSYLIQCCQEVVIVGASFFFFHDSKYSFINT